MRNWLKISLTLALLCVVSPLAVHAQEATAADKVVIHVDDNDAKTLNLSLNNVQNLLNYYKGKGQKVQIEVVANGPGLHMLRMDTSPVKDRITTLSAENADLRFSACANTVAAMEKQEGKKPELLSQAQVVPAGVVRILELEKQGYAYIKP